MRTRILTFSAIMLGIATITGCKSSQPTNMSQPTQKNPSTPSVAQISQDVMEDLSGEWSVTAIGDSVLDVEQLPVVTLQQPENKTEENKNSLLCYANGGCNIINGQFTVLPATPLHPPGSLSQP